MINKNKINHQKSAEIFDASMKAFGLSMNMQTDVELARSVLEEMKLHDFETNYPPMRRFFEEITSEPQDLGSMFENIKQGVTTKHPAIIEFAKKALAENWFAKSEYIQRSAHTTFILEALTAAMANSNKFYIEVQNHLLSKRREYGMNTRSLLSTFWRIWRMTGSVFNAAKTVSVDPRITCDRFRRELDKATFTKEHVKRLYREGMLTCLEYKVMLSVSEDNVEHYHDALRINIYEAGTTEYLKGFTANALSAHVISEEIKKNPHLRELKHGSVIPEHAASDFYASLIDENNVFRATAFNQDWISLYNSWDMAFILGNLDDIHILLPKLLIPSVIDAKNEYYFPARVVALWISINTLMFKRLDRIEEIKSPENKNEMAQAWGEINEKYARILAKEHTHYDINDVNKSFKKRFSWPVYNLVKLIVKF